MGTIATVAASGLIEELLEAHNSPDLDRAALLYAEDCEYVNRAYGIELRGRDGQRANMQAFLDRFPDRKLRPRRVFADEGEPRWRLSSWPRVSSYPELPVGN